MSARLFSRGNVVKYSAASDALGKIVGVTGAHYAVRALGTEDVTSYARGEIDRLNAQRYAVTMRVAGRDMPSAISLITDEQIACQRHVAEQAGWSITDTDAGFTMKDDGVAVTYIALGNDVADLEPSDNRKGQHR